MQELTGFTKGKIKQPLLIIVYGPDGSGKSTFAADAPNPIFIGPERGTANLDVARFDVSSWPQVLERSEALLNQKHDFQTVVYDSLDHIEALMWQEICRQQKVESIEESFGSYGKWVNGTLQEFSRLMATITSLREKRSMNVICIAHSQIKTMNDPSKPLPYDRYGLKLQERSAAKWREFVDAVLFANFDDVVFKANKNDRKAKASDGKTRKLYVSRQAAFDAKNRFGLVQDELPLSFSAFMEAVEKSDPNTISAIQKDLTELLDQIKIKDPNAASRMEKAIGDAAKDIGKLMKIRNHGRVLLES